MDQKACKIDRHPGRWLLPVLLAAAALCLLGVVSAIWWRTPANPQPSAAHDVPLGVEEAVIIRYAGARLVAQPYRRGASISLRIATETRRAGMGVYDVRYVVNLPGEFDLREYLAAADGSRIEDLPSFVVRGQSRLTKDLETRIREIEEVGVYVWHGYYETLAGLGVLWLLWLLGLIFIGRPARAPRPVPPPPEPTLAEQVGRLLELVASGRWTVEDKARLELLLLRYWRQQLPSTHGRVATACRQMRASDRLGPSYRALEAWLHDPAGRVTVEEILRKCGP